jgi:hypothetical protein
MTDKTFEGNKYCRTYVGGSKQAELDIFKKVQGTAEDNSECDWLEYRRILFAYLDDMLHVLSTWKTTFSNWSYAMLLLCVLFSNSQLLFIFYLSMGILFQIMRYLFAKKEEAKLRSYYMSYNIVRDEIKKSTGLEIE